MKLPPVAPPLRQAGDDPRLTPEMRKAAEGMEAVFTGEMMKAMRDTVDESEFSLKNSATEIYQGMLDQEYAQISAQKNSLGLAKQIEDYWLRSMPQDQYNKNRTPQVHQPGHPGNFRRTGGTNEGQSE